MHATARKIAPSTGKTIEEYYKDCIALAGKGKTGFRSRQQQLDFTLDMADTIHKERISIFESRTGTGKTLAYLLAAAVETDNDGEKTVTISTPQKHLQQEMVSTFERYVQPVFPFLSIALLKGRSNYVSVSALDLEEVRIEMSEDITDKEKASLLDELEKFRRYVDILDGDLDLVETVDPDKIPAAFAEDTRSKLAIPDHADSVSALYYELAKERAKTARIIVTNHHMLLASIMTATADRDKRMLPIDNIIIDEAHSFINAAYSFLHKSVAVRTVEDTLRQLLSLTSFMDKTSTGFKGIKTFTKALSNAKKDIREIRERLQEKAGEVAAINNSNLVEIKKYSAGTVAKGIIDRHVESIKKLTDDMSSILSAVSKMISKYDKHLVKMKGMKNAIDRFRDTCAIVNYFVQNGNGSNKYYYVSLSHKKGFPSLGAAQYDAAGWLGRMLWSKVDSAVLASGTIADPDSGYAPLSPIEGSTRLSIKCNHLKYELGINTAVKTEKILFQCAYTSHFEWENVVIHLYKDAPPFVVEAGNDMVPAKTNIFNFAIPHIADALKKTKGGGLMLTAAYEDISIFTECVEEMKNRNRKGGGWVNRKIIAQQPLMSMRMYVEEHRRDPGNSLLVLVGGWEGLDLPGNDLTALFIPRIPHISPDDPIYAARKKEKEKKKINSLFVAFRTEEFWRFRQGLGRLLRKEGDHGVIHIFDQRICNDNKHGKYKSFLQREFNSVVYH